MAESGLGSVPPPFGLRILVPALVESLPFDDLLLGFKVVNLAVGFLTAVLVWVFLLRFYGQRHALTALALSWLLIVGTPVSAIPESAWYPAQTDAFSNLFVWLAVCLALSPKPGVPTYLLCLTVFLLGSLTRENFPMFLTMFFLRIALPTRDRHPLSREDFELGLRLLAAVVGSGLGLWIVFQVTGANPLAGKSEQWVAGLLSQTPISVLAAVVNVYGAAFLFHIAWLKMASGSRKGRLPDHALGIGQANIALVTVAIGVVALGGGTNTERFLYWGVPSFVVYLVPEIDHILRHGRIGTIVAASVAIPAVIINRTFLPIEQSGIAKCSITSIFDGTSTWLGHWVQICPSSAEVNLIVAYAVCCVSVIGISMGGRRLLRTGHVLIQR